MRGSPKNKGGAPPKSQSDPRVQVAVSTPPGLGGIAEIHVWGRGSAAFVDSLFRARSGNAISRTPPERFLYGHIVRENRVLDEVIVRRKQGDRLYGAETVEIGCHGGGAAARAIIAALVELGAARSDFDAVLEDACIEGRISRIESDAHRALRSCVSERALPVLLAELDMHLLQREVEEISALIRKDASRAVPRIRDLLENTWAVAHVEPRPVFITGFPNVGKSSLFNALAGRERVIVHGTPGTTRDVVDEVVMLDELPVRLFDSAGVGRSETALEKLAEEFAFRAMREAALILLVFDGSRPTTEAEMKLHQRLDCGKRIPIINKADLPRAAIAPELAGALEISALTGQRLPELCSAIAGSLAGKPRAAGQPTLFTAGQRDLLKEALRCLEAGDARGGLEAAGRILRCPGTARPGGPRRE